MLFKKKKKGDPNGTVELHWDLKHPKPSDPRVSACSAWTLKGKNPLNKPLRALHKLIPDRAGLDTALLPFQLKMNRSSLKPPIPHPGHPHFG